MWLSPGFGLGILRDILGKTKIYKSSGLSTLTHLLPPKLQWSNNNKIFGSQNSLQREKNGKGDKIVVEF